MINKIIDCFKKLDKLTYKIMKKGLKFCFILYTISTIVFLTYNLANTSPNVYHIGVALFKLSCYFTVEFIVCGLVVDSIKKQIV